MSGEDLYEILGLSKGCSSRDIKKAYHRLARTHHPDKGGDPDKFKKITKAHEILSNEEKRENYDRYGDPDGQQGGGDASDIMSMFFGGGGGRGGRSGKKKGQNSNYPLKVTLKEFYTGTVKQISLKKNIICMKCKGKGGFGVSFCSPCKGKGVKMIVRQLGPGMIQQMQSQCGDCGGKGETVQRRCNTCYGRKVVPSTKTLDVNITRGMSNGEKIVFHGEAEQAPGVIPGNVIVILREEKHPVFRREGNNLFYKKKLSLKESLCGWEFILTHLDDRKLLVKSTPGKIIEHGDIKKIADEGLMDSFGRGDLYVEFEVDVMQPDQFTEEQKRRLRSLLPTVPPLNIDRDDEDVDEVSLIEVDIAAEKRKFATQKHKSIYDEDDEPAQRGGGTTTQCQTQ